MRSIDERFYKSKQWKKCRAEYIKKCGGLCERCYAQGLIVPGYIVHHKIHLNADNYQDPSIALSFDNLEYLCQMHHNEMHFSRKNGRYLIDDDGTVRILDGD